MPLLTCPDCGHQVSDDVRVCPGCGRPFQQSVPTFRPPAMDGPAKRSSWLLWLLISAAALGFVVALGTRGWALLAKARVECRALTPTTLSCSVASDGVRRAKACWDAVLECAGTVHRAHACSRPIPSRSTESYTIGDFSPKVEITEACGSMRVENITVE